MPLIAIGVNHRTAPVGIRERLSVSESQVPVFLADLRSVEGVAGAAVLSTCNRVEAILSVDSEDVIEPVVDWLSRHAEAAKPELERHLYVLRHIEVVKHLFRVASGLDSMIVGEPQIGGQVRAAFHLSRRHGALDPLLRQLFEQTMRVAKRVRSETSIGELAVSVPYAAVELAKKIFGELRGLKVLLLGAGDMGELTAQHLAEHEVRQIFVANKTYERAVALAGRFSGVAVHFDRFEEQVADCDVVIASTSAPHFLISSQQIERALAARPSRNLFLIDLAVPRNIEPTVADLHGAYLYNIDDLESVAENNLAIRHSRAGEAEQIVAREVEMFGRRLVAQDAVPTIVELHDRVEAIRSAELEKCLRRLGPISTEQRDAVEMLTTQMVNKILHYPILQLKETVDEPERESLRATIRKIFGLR
ncbi:MAG TPA: glutamyl-tRNA reductase [Thermoanaerobaculia bacterium]|nr:glutamyl-tRNA reductase [Thermoanaerobaculia bacterium]